VFKTVSHISRLDCRYLEKNINPLVQVIKEVVTLFNTSGNRRAEPPNSQSMHPNSSCRTVRWRDVSAMVVANVFLYEKKCVFEILQRLDYKECLPDQCFCCLPEGQGQCRFPSAVSLDELRATVTMCVRKYDLWRCFLLAWVSGAARKKPLLPPPETNLLRFLLVLSAVRKASMIDHVIDWPFLNKILGCATGVNAPIRLRHI